LTLTPDLRSENQVFSPDPAPVPPVALLGGLLLLSRPAPAALLGGLLLFCEGRSVAKPWTGCWREGARNTSMHANKGHCMQAFMTCCYGSYLSRDELRESRFDLFFIITVVPYTVWRHGGVFHYYLMVDG
jgi:hypothetical protein